MYSALENTHGFCLNNCIHTPYLTGTPHDAIKYLYQAATNAVMEKGYLPFEDTQFDDYAEMHGGFVLYNGGFTAGLTALVLIPILDYYNVKPKHGDDV